MTEELVTAVRAGGLLDEQRSAVVLASGGADSAVALAGTVGLLGSGRVHALHLNYGLREDSGEDEAVCRALCEGLGVELRVQRVELDTAGNVQAAARDARYRLAEEVRNETGAGVIVTGHTRTDLAETVLYRLASSPGRRALLGLAPRSGRVVRPLLGLSRGEVRELAERNRLPFRDDPTNEQPLYARNRIRAEVLPVLEELAPATEQTIAATWAELAEEGEALDELADRALESLGAGGDAIAAPAAGLAELHPALRRLALRRLAERSTGRNVPLGAERVGEIMRLADNAEGGVVELGGGVEASVEYGHIRFSPGAEDTLGEVSLAVPGSCTVGAWELRAELVEGRPPPPGPEAAALDAAKLGGELSVRGWREGDRMRPLGLDGSKSLQDLFSDAKVPRSLRRSLPVVLAGDRIAWVAGVAVSDEFKLSDETERATLLTARAL
ncbi:MAG: tRNA(Ile)-lysidine synthase [Solirubrobacterales bacterium]|jgi:tRNA(Ile)-lysidine synthase|nr:tRNA(Ile)-lysidine synthase [Solirubrobacterales bacterium]